MEKYRKTLHGTFAGSECGKRSLLPISNYVVTSFTDFNYKFSWWIKGNKNGCDPQNSELDRSELEMIDEDMDRFLPGRFNCI